MKKFTIDSAVNQVKLFCNDYLKEIKYLKFYFILIPVILILSYSVYLFLDKETVAHIGEEDHFFENMTVVFFVIGCILFFMHFIKTKNIFSLLLSVVLFVGAGEEISWGQRIFNINTPEKLKEVNMQGELNLHNIAVFQGTDLQDRKRNGIYRLLEINFLFRLWSILFGIVLPFFVYHFKVFARLSEKLKVPVPPISIGIYFFINWLIFYILHTYFLPQDESQFVDTASEIFECSAAFIFFMLSLYFYKERKMVILGKDIKQTI